MKPLCEMKSPAGYSLNLEEEEKERLTSSRRRRRLGLGLKCPLNRPTCNK